MGQRIDKESYLEGQMLIAMPGMSDPRFARAVIYMCVHSPEGAMGLIVNQPSPGMNLPQLLVQLGIVKNGQEDTLPVAVRAMPVQIGGPVDVARGFVLHSSDYFDESSTMAMAGGIGLTSTLGILKAIADGKGPRRALLALGYAGWGSGQLESEIQANGWLHCPADASLIFTADMDAKYERCLGKLGIDPGLLASEAGHA